MLQLNLDQRYDGVREQCFVARKLLVISTLFLHLLGEGLPHLLGLLGDGFRARRGLLRSLIIIFTFYRVAHGLHDTILDIN